MTSGPTAASRDSMLRVSAGAFERWVVTIPKSVKIIVSLAPASSMAWTSRRRLTPVAFAA